MAVFVFESDTDGEKLLKSSTQNRIKLTGASLMTLKWSSLNKLKQTNQLLILWASWKVCGPLAVGVKETLFAWLKKYFQSSIITILETT